MEIQLMTENRCQEALVFMSSRSSMKIIKANLDRKNQHPTYNNKNNEDMKTTTKKHYHVVYSERLQSVLIRLLVIKPNTLVSNVDNNNKYNN